MFILFAFISLFTLGDFTLNSQKSNSTSLEVSSQLLHRQIKGKDSLRYVISTSYYDEKTDQSQTRTRLIDSKGKILGQWGNEYHSAQSFDCLNYLNAKLYLQSSVGKKVISVDRNGKVHDLSDKYVSIMKMGQGFIGLRSIDIKNGYDIFNPNGKMISNTKGILFHTEFADNVISICNGKNWEIRDIEFNLLHKFPDDLETADLYPNHGLHTSSDGLIRIDRSKGNHYFVNKYGKTILDLSTVFDIDIILQLLPPSEGTVLVKHRPIQDSKVYSSYVDTSGSIIWSSTFEQDVEAFSFSGGYGKVKYAAKDLATLQKEAREKGLQTLSIEITSKLINHQGEESKNNGLYFPVIQRNGNLFLTHTALRTTDNRMHGYAIIANQNKTIIFSSEWPIIFFDENIVIVGDRDVYENATSDNLVVYDYTKKIIWRTPKI